jgi:hypothetical protein
MDDHYAVWRVTGVLRVSMWYVAGLPGSEVFRAHMNMLDSTTAQVRRSRVLHQLAQLGPHASVASLGARVNANRP